MNRTSPKFRRTPPWFRRTRTSTKMVSEWLQPIPEKENIRVPIPEKEYIRVLYVGKLQLPQLHVAGESMENEKEEALRIMISDIWKVARKFNNSNFISGHLSFTKSLYVVQLFEGGEDVVGSLMERIKRDDRVIIEKVFRKRLIKVNLGWEVSMSYSFNLSPADLGLIKNPNLSMEQLFDNITSTYEIKRLGVKLSKFYRNTVDIILLKYISHHQVGLVKVENSCGKY